MLLTILQNGAPLISLGPTGTILLTLLAAVLAIISWRKGTWKSTADAAAVELNFHRDAAERLRARVKELEVMAAQTNLQPLAVAINSWVLEGRARFDEASIRLNENTLSLKGLLEEVKAQRTTSEDSYRSMTAAFIAHTLDDKQAQLEGTRTQLRFVEALDQIERRLSQVAVQVGVARWETTPAKSANVE